MSAQAPTVHDPVCHMDITIASAAGRSEFEGETYYFCSMGCKRDFDADPRGFLDRDAEYDHSEGASMMEPAAAAPKRPFWQFWKK